MKRSTDWQTIARAIDDISARWDPNHRLSNRTQAWRLYQESDLDLDSFMSAMRAAYVATVNKAGLRRKAAYFFVVLTDEVWRDSAFALGGVFPDGSRDVGKTAAEAAEGLPY